jgi:hypothetical protein
MNTIKLEVNFCAQALSSGSLKHEQGMKIDGFKLHPIKMEVKMINDI